MPADGVLALGREGEAMWLYAPIDLARVAAWRGDGSILTHRDWDAQPGAGQLPVVEYVDFAIGGPPNATKDSPIAATPRKSLFRWGMPPQSRPDRRRRRDPGQVYRFDNLGHGSNRDAEWLALNAALRLSQSLGLTHVELIGDALEVITLANRAMESGQGGDHHGAAFLSLIATHRPARIRWIKRQQNLAGIALAARHPR
jgi:ribonuclease HI